MSGIQIQKFTFNPFQENTYVLFDETRETVIIDPGCYTRDEDKELLAFIEKEQLKPVRVLNTHCHVDHILGNAMLYDKFKLKPELHRKDLPVLHSTTNYGAIFGINVTPSPDPDVFIEEGDVITFGNSELEVLFVPGHAPGHVVFLNREQKILIGGDVLFYGSIGRTDLPYGDHDALIENIEMKLFTLDPSVEVHPGHGPSTSIGFEKENNPFLR